MTAGAPAPATGTGTEAVVKLRPGTHLVPTPRGLYCWRAGRSFVLGGPPSLFRLVDGQLDALTDGTTVADLAVRAGEPAAAPVLDRLVRVLLREDILVEVSPYDAAPPDAATRERYADVLSRLEERCAQPYAAFAALRAARVAVTGQGLATRSVTRTLAEHGVSVVDGPDADLVVWVSDVDAWPSGVDAPVLPVVVRPDLILVGPVLPGPAALPGLLAAAERAARWQRLDPTDAPPPVVGAALAGSLAAIRAVDRLSGVSTADRDAVVVHGRTARTTVVPSTVDNDAADPATDAEVLARAAVLTERWRGLARWTARDNGAREYGSLWVAGLRPLDGPTRYAWGESEPAARRAAAVALLRDHVRASGPAPAPGAVAAAGATPAHWYLDGALRLAGRPALNRPAVRELRRTDLSASPVRAMWSALADYFDRPVRVAEHRAPGLAWSLIRVTDAGTGAPLAAEWGPSTVDATRAALAAVLAGIRSGTPVADDPVGTALVERLPAAVLGEAVRGIRAGRAPRAARMTVDHGLGAPPLPCGWLWYPDDDRAGDRAGD